MFLFKVCVHFVSHVEMMTVLRTLESRPTEGSGVFGQQGKSAKIRFVQVVLSALEAEYRIVVSGDHPEPTRP